MNKNQVCTSKPWEWKYSSSRNYCDDFEEILKIDVNLGNVDTSRGDLNNLKELDLSLCKDVEAFTEAISTVKTLKYLHLFQSGVIESLQSLANLTSLEELSIENKSKLMDKNISFLDKIPNLEYSIEIGSFGAGSDK
ncbi:hypothetical protein [Elizabethkingia bruuniana]|uniref:hypothetical protein n=1 Tax=Elizabethkingia bruuniana TaxID=1756149 RepID=UPI00241E50BE|nr:hypothetical protein [Elizabethkingia bruuniana]